MPVQRLEGKDLWRSRARELQRRLRDRLRVAVDNHCDRPVSGSYFSSVIIQRWLLRFRDFRLGSVQTSSAFYRRRVNEDFSSEEDSTIARLLTSVAIPVLGNMCYIFMNGLNRMQVYGVENLHNALLKRPQGKPLLTVSNHVASVDDPFVIASLVPPGILMDAENLRWTLCATDRCFTSPLTSAFFKTVKVLPVSRGEGIYQKGMDMAISKLNNGGWVHIFPEGSRSRDGGKTLGRPKRGVGRLVLDSDNVPVVIPFIHVGMDEILPIGAKVPRINKTVTIVVGGPIYFDDLMDAEGNHNMPRGKLYDAVASRIGQRLQQLKSEADRLSCQQTTASLQASPSAGNTMAAEVSPHYDRQSNSEQDKMSLHWSSSPDNYSGGMISRIRGHMQSFELLSFAARGLFARSRPTRVSLVEGNGTRNPLLFWKQLLAGSMEEPGMCCY